MPRSVERQPLVDNKNLPHQTETQARIETIIQLIAETGRIAETTARKETTMVQTFILFSIPATIIAATMWTMWPFFLLCAGLYASIHLAIKYGDHVTAKKKQRHTETQAIIDRAYTQHRAILDGELEQGTFGGYPPPKGLRDLP